jgi:GxxExxY protein
MTTNEITSGIVDAAYRIHSELGPGLLESVYKIVLADSLRKKGFQVARQVPIPLRFEGNTYDEGFRADLVVEGCVIVEIKSINQLAQVHKKQVLTSLKLSGIRVGLLINFGGPLLKDNITRLVFGEVPDLKEDGSHGAHGEHGDTERDIRFR